MEKQTNTIESTKANELLLQGAEAEEFRAYQKRKRALEIAERIASSEGTLMGAEDVQRVCERARRLKQAALQLPLTKLSQAKYYLRGSTVAIDCVVGGTGETTAQVKAYEARRAVRGGAKEITVRLTPSLMDGCRFGELKKELRRVKRAAGKIPVKAAVDKNYSLTALSRAARVAAEVGVSHFCVPYFEGCERLRLDTTGSCKLQVEGVREGRIWKKLTNVGVARIVTECAWEIYHEWLREGEEKSPSPSVPDVPNAPPAPVTRREEEKECGSQTDYRCRLEGTTLKFF